MLGAAEGASPSRNAEISGRCQAGKPCKMAATLQAASVAIPWRVQRVAEAMWGTRITLSSSARPGAMAGSFNTREYFHGASPRKYKAVKWYFLVLVFPVPLLLLVLFMLIGRLEIFTVLVLFLPEAWRRS